jgi:hypothetical protein
VVDVAGTGDHGVHECEHLASGLEATIARGDMDQLVDQGLETELSRHACHYEQAGVGDEIVLAECHCDPIETARY